jgi:hypothetical protein
MPPRRRAAGVSRREPSRAFDETGCSRRNVTWTLTPSSTLIGRGCPTSVARDSTFSRSSSCCAHTGRLSVAAGRLRDVDGLYAAQSSRLRRRWSHSCCHFGRGRRRPHWPPRIRTGSLLAYWRVYRSVCCCLLGEPGGIRARSACCGARA